MRNTTSRIKSIDRALAWVALAFGVILTVCGGLILLSGGGQDAAGILGGIFVFGGLALVILAFPDPTAK